jgi:cytochrome c-type biogenesis protein CcmE
VTPKRRFVIAAGVIVASILGLIIWSLSGSTAYYKTAAEVASGKAEPDRVIRVAGKVVAGSVSHKGGATRFAIADGDASVPISTAVSLPDTFAPGVDVVAEGAIDHRGLFTASDVLVKCPSKFKAKLAAG